MISRNSVIYQIVTDRFDNEKGNLARAIKNKSYNEMFKSFLGGTFKGITHRIPYLQELGVTHVLVSPVQDSIEYHGYNYENNLKINQRFGDKKDLEEMINKLDDAGIKTIMDYVATHVAISNPIFREKIRSEKEKNWFLHNSIKKDEEYRDYYGEVVYKLTSGNPENLESINHSLEHLGYFGLEKSPLLNLKNKEVLEWHKEVLFYWIDNFNFSDIRLDSGFIQPKKFIKDLGTFLNKKYTDISLIVEYWDFEANGGNCYGFSEGELDVKGTLLLNSMNEHPEFFRDLRKHYMKLKDLFTEHKFIWSLGNNDLPRFKGGQTLQKMASIIQFTFPQIPLIYYGNEIPMNQYNDESDKMGQSRDVMRFDLNSKPLFDFYKRLIQFRKINDFSNPKISDIKVNDNCRLFSYRVNLGDANYYVIINNDLREKPVNTFELLGDENIPNYDIIGDRELKVINKNVLLIGSEEAYLLGDKQINLS